MVIVTNLGILKHHAATAIALLRFKIGADQFAKLFPNLCRWFVLQGRGNLFQRGLEPEKKRTLHPALSIGFKGTVFGHGGFDQQLFLKGLLLVLRRRVAGFVVKQMQPAPFVDVDPVCRTRNFEIMR